jgi:hypothetical protein
VVGAGEGGDGAVDADGEWNAAVSEMGELGAEPAAKSRARWGYPSQWSSSAARRNSIFESSELK